MPPLTIRLENHTVWNGAHLKAIIHRAARQVGYDKRWLRVTVRYTNGRHGGSSGCAWIGGMAMTIRIGRHGKRRLHRIERAWIERCKREGRPDDATGTRAKEQYPPPDNADFAEVAAHEALHCMGWTHQQMSESHREVMRHTPTTKFDWADDMPMEARKHLAKKPAPSKLERARADLANAQARAKAWHTKRKRADTGIKTWATKVRVDERRVAALEHSAAQLADDGGVTLTEEGQ